MYVFQVKIHAVDVLLLESALSAVTAVSFCLFLRAMHVIINQNLYTLTFKFLIRTKIVLLCFAVNFCSFALSTFT